MVHKRVWISAVAALCLVLGFEVHAKELCRIIVREGMSIQVAISLAPAGAVVCLEPGSWSETIVITKTLTLRGIGGKDKTTIHGGKAMAPIIRVEGGEGTEVIIDGVTVTDGFIGVLATGSARVGVANSDILRCGYGIAIAGSARATITRCSVRGCEFHGILVTDSAAATLHTTTIERNNTWFCAFLVERSAAVSMANARIAENKGTGLWVGNTARADIRDTVIEDNQRDGIAVGGTARLTLSNSTVVGNKWRGVALGDSAHVTLVSNRIAANGMYGVFLYELPCADTDLVFSGYLAGRGNVIPDILEMEGNGLGAICPRLLTFLVTEVGGELDRRR